MSRIILIGALACMLIWTAYPSGINMRAPTRGTDIEMAHGVRITGATLTLVCYGEDVESIDQQELKRIWRTGGIPGVIECCIGKQIRKPDGLYLATVR